MSLPVILMYHSVDNRSRGYDTWGLSVSPDNFAAQIEALVAERTVVPLEELARCVRAGSVPGRYAAITFDDGYANNITIAKPILKRYNAPATLFLMTAAVDSLGFWWDRLERIVMEADFIPAMFCIPLQDRPLEITAEGVDRTQILREIWSRLRLLDTAHRDRAIAYIADMLAVQPEDLALRPLTSDELRNFNDGLLSVGAHTHNHPSLPQLGPIELMREIADSTGICERLLNRRITAFAYPFGDYDDRVRATVAETGLTIACTTVPRSVQSGDDCLALPRVAVFNWTSEEFIRYLPSSGSDKSMLGSCKARRDLKHMGAGLNAGTREVDVDEMAFRHFSLWMARSRILFGLTRRVLVGRSTEVRSLVNQSLRDHGIRDVLAAAVINRLSAPRVVLGLARRRLLAGKDKVRALVMALMQEHVVGSLRPSAGLPVSVTGQHNPDGSEQSVASSANFDFGGLGGLSPITDNWGFGRGQPIDRVYIERFLSRHSGDIRGHVLEINDNIYTVRFGAGRVGKSIIADVDTNNAKATIIADLTNAPQIPDSTFDCVILTQVLELIFDVEAALRTVSRILKPGGVALITVPGISQISSDASESAAWSWSFYPQTLRRLLVKHFDPQKLIVQSFGNVKTVIGFLAGLGQSDLAPDVFHHDDSRYPLIVAARAIKHGLSPG
jgi:peptidoglycan/xylan/chitin deacetylase (PgdA/CDA1 family)/SAM-dependent methyltransferase